MLVLMGVTLALAGCGGKGESTTAGTTTARPPTITTQTPPRTTSVRHRTTPEPGTPAPTRTVVTTPAHQKPAVIEIRIAGGKPVGGIRRATVTKPQLVELVVKSDVADEVHLHGYDLHQDVAAGGTARIRFQAKIQGVFEAELENRKLQILELTVK
jgi:hypothetical protein